MEIEHQKRKKKHNVEGSIQQMKQILQSEQIKTETHKKILQPTFGPFNKKIKFRFPQNSNNDDLSIINENDIQINQKSNYFMKDKNFIQKKYIPLESIEIEDEDKENIENYCLRKDNPKLKTQNDINQEGNSIFRNLILQIHDKQFRKN